VVTGNHEYYSGAEPWIAELRRLGLTVLMNEHVVLTHPGAAGGEGAAIVLAGVADWSAHHFVPAHRSDPHRAVAGAPAAAIKVLLAHQPRSAPAAADAGFHLQLSGHTHGGQFPALELLPSASSNPSRRGSTGCATSGSTRAAARATGARPSGSVRLRRSRKLRLVAA
jgi:predicted MPP superfamily phosphohydrolase